MNNNHFAISISSSDFDDFDTVSRRKASKSKVRNNHSISVARMKSRNVSMNSANSQFGNLIDEINDDIRLIYEE